jgi:hypothetical protein
MLNFMIIIIILSCGVASLIVMWPYIVYISSNLYSMLERKSKNITIKMPEIQMSIFRSNSVFPQKEETNNNVILLPV